MWFWLPNRNTLAARTMRDKTESVQELGEEIGNHPHMVLFFIEGWSKIMIYADTCVSVLIISIGGITINDLGWWSSMRISFAGLKQSIGTSLPHLEFEKGQVTEHVPVAHLISRWNISLRKLRHVILYFPGLNIHMSPLKSVSIWFQIWEASRLLQHVTTIWFDIIF